MEIDTNEELLFRLVQNYLKKPPLIVWGSGATIPFGMPSMSDLNEILKDKLPEFDGTNNNLEKELGKEKYLKHIRKIRGFIGDAICKSDLNALSKIISKDESFAGIKSMFDNFYAAHPHKLDIVTTNYDCILEYMLSYNQYSYTDGFTDKKLSLFNDSLFRNRDIVNVIKVHGSLNWFDIDGDIRFLSADDDTGYEREIIPPGKNKYQEAYKPPYRELIQKADSCIKSAQSFFAVGFGFNDEHLTPEIIRKVKEGIPIVLITKKVTTTTHAELKNAQKYIFLEEADKNRSMITYKRDNIEGEKTFIIDGNYWELTKFMNIYE